MPKAQLESQAPDFTLIDYAEQPVTLSDFQNHKNVLLIFNRGFA